MNVETVVPNEDGGYSKCSKGLMKEYKDNAQADSHIKDKKGGREVVCYKCLHGGILLCCCGKGCQRRCHPYCVDPPLNYVPPGFWHCIWCVKKKIKLGVHSVSEGIESILDSREAISNDKVMQKEYFVKYHGLAHAHNCWIPEGQILLEAPKLLAKFKRSMQVVRWKRDWSIPHRLLLKRQIVLSRQNEQSFDGYDDKDSICRNEWLVKWTGLGYDNVTWELDDAAFLTSPQGMKLIDDYISRQKRADRLSKYNFEANEERKTLFAELSMLPFGEPGSYNQHLSYVNKLRLCWHKGQSAVTVDDQIDQERVTKVILFILSLICNVKRPFLIISTSNALSVWETEFLHLAPSANLVVYRGKKDIRSSIRALEFFNEDSGPLFQILLSSSDIIVEDLHALRCIPWEAIIVDECQRPSILGHLDSVKHLKAEMRLLLLSGQIKEDRADYIKLLSFLKTGHHESYIAQMETYFSANISNLKNQLEQYVVASYTRFVEYWVPAHLSSLQLEQYCSMLLSNLRLLCSGQKSDSVDALHELIISTRKCCNHPYLLDPSLDNFLTKGLPVEEHLNIGIKASGKLQLLEKILLEARILGLRVLVLFQSTGGPRSIGDILDDVLCRRFGKDCYVRYDRCYIPSKKQVALDKFNDRESDKFVFLMENRACLPSVKLSSVDTVILFDSDLDPQNDLRGLQRMSISSQFKQLMVFRLYLYFTVEEKILMLAKEGIVLENNMQMINHSTCHALLKWGSSYLFSKLDDLHANVTSVSTPDIRDQSLLGDVICELSSQLVGGDGNTDSHGWSFISRVLQNGGEYARNISLLGERVMKKLDNESHAFSWSDLLERRHPRWKFLSVSSQRIRKTVRYFDEQQKESECDNDAIKGKRTVSKGNVDPNTGKAPKDNLDSKRLKVSKDNVGPRGRKMTKDKGGPKKRKMSKGIVNTKGRKVSNHVIDSKGRKVYKNVTDCKNQKIRLKNKKNLSDVNGASGSNGNTGGLSDVLDFTEHHLTNESAGTTVINMQFSEKKEQLDLLTTIKFLPKPDISGLCDILHFSKDVKVAAIRILEHIFKRYNVNCQDVSTKQAFEISVCWLAASLLKHKIDRKDSLALAKLYLNFDCKEVEVSNIYSELCKSIKDFLSCLRNGFCIEKFKVDVASDSKTPDLKDLMEKQRDFQDPSVLKQDISINAHDSQRKSPTIVASKDQSHKRTPGILSVETDGISMECNSKERMNTMASIMAEVSSSDHRRNDVNHVTGSLERQSPVGATEIIQSDGNVSEDDHISLNEVADIDDVMNTCPHSEQLDGVWTDAVHSVNSDSIPEVRQWYDVMSPVCDESTTPEFVGTTLPCTQPLDANLWPLPQMENSAVPSFLEHDSASTVEPLDNSYHSSEDNCYILEDDIMSEAPNDHMESVNSSVVSPVILQPSTSVAMNENTTHPYNINNLECMNSDSFQAHSVTSEMSHVAYPDSLQIEMEKIEKQNEEAYKIHEQKKLQLQSDYEKEVENLGEKYRMLLQNVHKEVALKRMELERQRKLVFMNKVLAEVWVHKLDTSEEPAAQRTEQVAVSGPPIIQPSLSSPTVLVNPSITIPEIDQVRESFDPMIQLCNNNILDGSDFLAALSSDSAAASSYSVPLLSNPWTGISDQQLPHR